MCDQDRIELMENQLEEAQELAQTSNHKVKIIQIWIFRENFEKSTNLLIFWKKYEEAERRYRMVQNELERAVERADDYEKWVFWLDGFCM